MFRIIPDLLVCQILKRFDGSLMISFMTVLELPSYSACFLILPDFLYNLISGLFV